MDDDLIARLEAMAHILEVSDPVTIHGTVMAEARFAKDFAPDLRQAIQALQMARESIRELLMFEGDVLVALKRKPEFHESVRSFFYHGREAYRALAASERG